MIPPAVSVLFGAAFTLLTCWALGSLLLRRLNARLASGETLVFSLAGGGALLSLMVFLVCLTGLASPAVFLALGALPIAAVLHPRLRAGQGVALPALELMWRRLFLLIFVPYFVLYFVNAMAPENSPDGSTYHLGLVAHYLREGGLQPLATNIFSHLPAGVEMLFLFAFAFGGHSAASLVHFAFLVALPLALVLYGRRFGLPGVGAAAALFFFLAPVAGMDGTSAYNDVALACVLFLVFYALEMWAAAAPDSGESRGLAVLAGLLAGFAFAIKYTAFMALLYVPVYMFWKKYRHVRRPWPEVLAACVSAACSVGPWLIRNWYWIGNPVSPFFNAVFPNPHVHRSFELILSSRMRDFRTYGLDSAWEIPRALLATGELGGILGPLFVLCPIGLVALRSPAGRRWLLAGLLFGLPFAANIGCRFLLPALPFASLALASALSGVRWVVPILVLVHAWASWPTTLKSYFPPLNFIVNSMPVQAAMRIEPEDRFLRRTMPAYSHARLIEERVPANGAVLAYDDVSIAYTARNVLVPYQGAFNSVADDVLKVALYDEFGPVQRIHFSFPSKPLKRFRLVQAGSSHDSWSVHQLRVFHAGGIIVRKPGWRLRASPNPWDVEMAFDENPVTRWRSWQPASPGMWMEADFGTPQAADAIVVECSADQPGLRLRLELEDAEGRWETVQEASPRSLQPPPPGLGRAAVEHLKRLGITHLFIFQKNPLDAMLRQRADEWGLVEIGVESGARLYRLR